MKEKWLKIGIIVVIVISIILLIAVLANLNKDPGYQDYREDGDESVYIKKENVTPVKNETMFYTVATCMQRYYALLTLDINKEYPVSQDGELVYSSYNSAQSQGITTEKQKKEVIYQLLSPSYIQENNITVDNINSYVEYTNRPLKFTAISMNEKDDQRVKTYSVYGKLETEGTSEFVKNVYYIVELDIYNMTFTVKPLLKENYTSIDEVVLEKESDQIEINDYNKFTYNRITEGILLNNYIGHYKKNALNYPEEMYEYLDKEYREKKFGSVEAFKQYVNENRDSISKIILDKYQKTKENDYTQYVCIDTKGKYYIFREVGTLKYTLLLDNYTVDLPEFTKKYNAGTDVQKVGMNIEKIINAINDKDYNYVYSKLSDGFKNNYFLSVDELKKYIQNNFYENNKVSYGEMKTEGKNYIYTVTVEDANSKITTSREKTFIIRLDSGTGFTIAFDI